MASLKVYSSCFTRILHTHGHESVQAVVSTGRQYSKQYQKEAGKFLWLLPSILLIAEYNIFEEGEHLDVKMKLAQNPTNHPIVHKTRIL